MKNLNLIKFSLILSIMFLFVGLVNAGLESTMFGFGQDMALNFISGQNPNLGKAISILVCPQCAIQGETLKSLEAIGIDSKYINALVDPTSALKNEAFNEIYNELNPKDKKIVDNIKNLKPYIEKTFEVNPNAPKGQEKATIITDSEGTTIVKDSKGDILARIPSGFDVASTEDKISNKMIITFTNKDADKNAVLQIKDYKIKAEKDAKITFRDTPFGSDIRLEGSGDVDAAGVVLNNIKDAEIGLDKDKKIEYASFTATQRANYKFVTNDGEDVIFSADEGSKINYNPTGEYFSGENIHIRYKNEEAVGNNVRANYNKNNFKQISFIGEGQYKKLINNEKLVVNFDKSTIFLNTQRGCIGVKINCIEFDETHKFMRVIAKEGNIEIIDPKDLITEFDVPIILDSNIILNKNNEVKAIISSDSLKWQGDSSKILDTTITTSLKIDNEIHDFIIKDGKIIECSICKELGNIKKSLATKSGLTKVSQITVNPSVFTDVENTNKRILNLKKIPFERYDINDPNSLKKLTTANSEIIFITGHHYTGEGKIWGDKDEKLEFNNLPRSGSIGVAMFSACHTVMNPDYLRESLEESREKGFQTAEEFVGQLEKAYPNLRLVVGYETIAPGTDKIFESITPNIKTLENNEGFKNFGDLALKASENYFKGWVGHEKDSAGWRYNTDKEGQRMAYYLKGSDGMWRYYSLDHSGGVPLDFEKSNEIYRRLYEKR